MLQYPHNQEDINLFGPANISLHSVSAKHGSDFNKLGHLLIIRFGFLVLPQIRSFSVSTHHRHTNGVNTLSDGLQIY